MTIDFKTAEVLVKRYLGGTVIVILLFSAAGWKLWSEYKNLDEKREALEDREQKFSNAQIDFEKYRSTTYAALDKERLDVEKREFVVDQLEKKNQAELEALQQQAKQYSDAFNKIQTEQVTLSATGQQKAAEDRMEQLMSEFATLGVNLDQVVKCSDAEGMSQYNKASAKFDEIVAFARAHNLLDEYRAFIQGQAAGFRSSCE